MADQLTHPDSTAGKKPDETSSVASTRDTLESILIALILAFLFRAYVVEAFVIPTGSMAPTLLGAHAAATCPQCGHEIVVDVDERRWMIDDVTREPQNSIAIDNAIAYCSMCHYAVRIPRGSRLDNGDRILVQKYLYQVSEPQRWDVVVFKSPENPSVNFIKRLVGLPNEQLMIVDGNVYTQPDGADRWQIARKTDRPDVQRAVWQPIYHSRFVPLDSINVNPGVKPRWTCPWEADLPGSWEIEGRRSYRHPSADLGAIHFNFDKAVRSHIGIYAYNHIKDNDLRATLDSEDVRIAAAFQPESDGLELTLSTTGMLDSPNGVQQRLIARISAAGLVTIETDRLDADDTPAIRTQKQIAPLPAGVATDVELWYCDQEASVWVNGEKVAFEQFDLSIQTVTQRPRPEPYPHISITVRGTPVTLHRVQVDRDIYYTNRSGSRRATGSFTRNGPGYQLDNARPVDLRSDQFFCLGDNSPMSQDSRFWDNANPWIRASMFADDETFEGKVPRELMMGRAFFVYFPAVKRTDPSNRLGVPNFGDMRFIH